MFCLLNSFLFGSGVSYFIFVSFCFYVFCLICLDCVFLSFQWRRSFCVAIGIFVTIFRSFCLSIYPFVCNPYLCHRFILKKLRRHSLKQTAAHCSPKLYGSKSPSLQVGGRSAAVSPPPRLCTGRTSVSKSSAFRGNTKPREKKKKVKTTIY